MGNDFAADEYYSFYTHSLIRGEEAAAGRYRRLWLDAQTDDLPEGLLGDCYRGRIEKLKGEAVEDLHMDEIIALEEKLLSLRFSYNSLIGGKKYSYRELASQLRADKGNTNVSKALVDEAFLLADNGLVELILARNRIAREAGFENYWTMINGKEASMAATFLFRMNTFLTTHDYCAEKDRAGSKREEKQMLFKERQYEEPLLLETAVAFFLSLLYSNSALPKMEIGTRKGSECPAGPPGVTPMAYIGKNSEKGGGCHKLNIDLPFVRFGTGVKKDVIFPENLGPLFHELTHLLHFASVDQRGGWAFPPELAAGNLFYEAEALCFQNIALADYKGEPLRFDRPGFKDLIYVAESERLLYGLDLSSADDMKAFLKKRMVSFYPDGGFSRSPLGASHLLKSDTAGRYWNYPGAAFLGIQKSRGVCRGQTRISPPEYWPAGNQVSWEQSSEELLSDITLEDFSMLSDDTPFTLEFQRRDLSDIRKEICEAGIIF
ncbi:MAG: hypothetical protein JEY99_03490 [Spirochaetales bacterium]|nr:hypothetical protein [Spirochaetales bacterium]